MQVKAENGPDPSELDVSRVRLHPHGLAVAPVPAVVHDSCVSIFINIRTRVKIIDGSAVGNL